MDKNFLIVSNEILYMLEENEIEIESELMRELDINLSKTNTPLTTINPRRDIVQVLDALNSLNEVYEFVKYIRQLINVVKFSKTKYLKIYKKDKKKYTLEKKLDINERNFMEELREVVTDTSNYVFEFLTSTDE